MGRSNSIDSILIATDGSPGWAAAAEEGVRLAKIIGADVIFVAVAQRPLSVLGNPYYLRSLSGQLGSMRAALAKAIAFARERRVSFETELMVGPPAKKILELARSRDVGLIVVGSRGHDAAKGTLLGSVSSSIVHHADRPVLVTRTGDRVARGRLSRMAV